MPEEVTAAFEAQRERLRAVARRVLGSSADAEDVVQEAWLRLSRQDVAEIGNLEGWLTTVVARLSLDVLRSRRSRPEAPYEEVVVAPPLDDVELADSVGLAMLVVLESLGPNERLAFVLHDLFAVPFDEIARILGKSVGATKMLASRARRKVRTPARTPAGGSPQEVVKAFLAAAREGDFEGLLRVLDPDVRLAVDTPGGVVVVLGATKVLAGARLRALAAGAPVLVGGRPGAMSWHPDGTPRALVEFTVEGGRVTGIVSVATPERLATMRLPTAPHG